MNINDAIEKRKQALSEALKVNSNSKACSPQIDEMTLNRIKALLKQGNKLQAIKLLREKTGWGLAEAKKYVESI